MTPTEAVKALEAIQKGDFEAAHCEADEILLVFLKSYDCDCADIAKAWTEANKRVGGFQYA